MTLPSADDDNDDEPAINNQQSATKLTHNDRAQHCNQECWHSRLPPVSHKSMAMKIAQVIRSGMPYMNHLVSHTALPEAGASKNLPL